MRQTERTNIKHKERKVFPKEESYSELKSYSYETWSEEQNHAEEVSTQAMKLSTLNTVKGTTENAPQGGKQKTIKHW